MKKKITVRIEDYISKEETRFVDYTIINDKNNKYTVHKCINLMDFCCPEYTETESDQLVNIADDILLELDKNFSLHKKVSVVCNYSKRKVLKHKIRKYTLSKKGAKEFYNNIIRFIGENIIITSIPIHRYLNKTPSVEDKKKIIGRSHKRSQSHIPRLEKAKSDLLAMEDELKTVMDLDDHRRELDASKKAKKLQTGHKKSEGVQDFRVITV